MKKTDAWVVLRLDRDAVGLKDYIAVKGVYDSEDDARAALPNSSAESDYIVIRSRHYLKDDREENIFSNHSEKVQGLTIKTRDGHINSPDTHELFGSVRALSEQFTLSDRRQVIWPILSKLAELVVAQALDASRIDDINSDADLKLPDGKLVEVKTIFLDPDRRKSPNLQFRSDALFDFIAIVIFNPDLSIATARLIPAEALELYARPASGNGNHSKINLRVIQPFLDYPGSRDIPLANYALSK